MNSFYNRYVPPPKVTSSPSQPEPPASEKRKPDGEPDRQKKRRKLVEQNEIEVNVRHREPVQTQSSPKTHLNGHGILQKYSISNFAKANSPDAQIEVRKPRRQKQDSLQSTVITDDTVSAKNHNAPPTSNETSADSKHADVLQKYDKSRKRSSKQEARNGERMDNATSIDVNGIPPTPVHDLVPLPQPEAREFIPKTPKFSVRPAWQDQSIKAEPKEQKKLKKLGLSDKVMANLKSNSIDTALPIQSSVIPMLMPGTNNQGDVCVQAATGSGKTLSYVVPVVENLLRDRDTGLRAVIVVPTQELVKQVARTCRMCVSGTSLNVLTAAGNKSLEKEEESLVELEQIYDPEAYQKQCRTPIDWTTFSLEQVLKRARRMDPEKEKDYVVRMRIKADILITTPGRLVDHLAKSDGFHLDDVKWLVIDEADRLLNQSYQDWVDVVVPALKSRKNFEEMDRILTHMRLKPPPRIVRKVLLSASMTKDISKLGRLELSNPKLVVLDSSTVDSNSTTDVPMEDARNEQAEDYQLPSTLEEYAVTLKEGTDKPLLLLQMLQTQIGIRASNIGITEEEDSTSSSGSESDSDEESGDSTDTSSDESSSSETDEDTASSSNDSLQSSIVSNGSTQRKRPKAKVPSQSTSSSEVSSSNPRALIFTRSADSASRLSRLLGLISPSLKPLIATLTRSTTSSLSRKALSAFRSGQTPILITTDRASRGIDVPGLGNVINYDIPGSTLVYVHRVGRTARAGQVGKAWTLVEHREGRWFWNEIGGKSNECKVKRRAKIQRVTIAVEKDGDLSKRYEGALKTLGQEARGE